MEQGGGTEKGATFCIFVDNVALRFSLIGISHFLLLIYLLTLFPLFCFSLPPFILYFCPGVLISDMISEHCPGSRAFVEVMSPMPNILPDLATSPTPTPTHSNATTLDPSSVGKWGCKMQPAPCCCSLFPSHVCMYIYVYVSWKAGSIFYFIIQRTIRLPCSSVTVCDFYSIRPIPPSPPSSTLSFLPLTITITLTLTLSSPQRHAYPRRCCTSTSPRRVAPSTLSRRSTSSMPRTMPSPH